MITQYNTDRAIEAIKRGDIEYFNGDLDDYIMEVLEAAQMPLNSSELDMLKTEMIFIANTVPLDEQVSAIEEVFETEESTGKTEDKEQALYQPPNSVRNMNIGVAVLIIGCISLLTYIG